MNFPEPRLAGIWLQQHAFRHIFVMKLQVKKVKPHLVQGTAGFEQVRKMF